jgi:hypothetical protein
VSENLYGKNRRASSVFHQVSWIKHKASKDLPLEDSLSRTPFVPGKINHNARKIGVFFTA